ncbi:PilC/PilY family type IV pilus protein [Pseudomonas profundi]|uniref:PilC/PilY family type IV pilus protein n=1 Tax=Pseudomonas profundi TaxID=1981513 RepID=UPI00123930E9|nr:PilC/PilY family type IV pilus protein [Pseudomonas profundi]
MEALARILTAAVLTLGTMVAPSTSLAEDVEIYYSDVLSDDSVNKNVANVLIMLDTSGSMRNCQTGSGATWCDDRPNRRINILHDVMENILDDAAENINIGLGRFDGDSGGRIILPVMPVNEKTRPHFDQALDDINPRRNSEQKGDVMPRGGTPTSLAFDEMAKYMLGKKNDVYYDNDGGQYCVEDEFEEQCTTDIEYSDGVPVDYCDEATPGCSVNLVSERLAPGATCDPDADNCEIQYDPPVSRFFWESPACSPKGPLCLQSNWYLGVTYQVGHYYQQTRTYSQSEVANEVTSCEMVKTGKCAKFAQIESGSNYVSPIVEANQCESNHVILFTDGEPSGDDPRSVDLVSCNNNSYSCQVNIAKLLDRDSNAVKRAIKTHNIGLHMSASTLENMQKVSGAGGGSTYNSDNAESLLLAFKKTLDLIADEANTMVSPGVAVSQSERFQHLDEMYYALFKPIQSSYWQGNLKRYKVSIDKEGESSVLDAQGRNALDDTGAFSSGSRSWWGAENDGADVLKGGARGRLASSSRRLFYSPSPGGTLKRFNLSDLTNAELLLPAEATDAVRQNVANELLNMWGDPLHSQPIMVNYGGTTVGENFIEDNTVFVSTNAGMLHAIDTKTGDEKFAFMPYEFISQASSFTVNRLPLKAGNKRQTYGLDGTWTAWRQRGATVESAPSQVMLYGGMRRGGNSYFGLDVTNVTTPVLKWQITGGTGDYKDLGQTWSTPKVARFPTADGGSIPVVIFGGGYSPDDHDEHKSRQNQDAKGNAIYVVNANSGELVWSAGGRSGNVMTHVNEMTHSITGSLAVADLNSDGVVDHLYYADLGGQIFRADIDSSKELAHKVVKLANLGGSGADHRRFYEQPTVAFVSNGNNPSLFIAVASGYRAHPLSTVSKEALFVLRDHQPFGGTARTAAGIADFSDITSGTLPDSTKRGWFYYLEHTEGEKALSSPVVFDNTILFTTYSPNVETEGERDPCSVNYGAAFIHRVDLLTGEPAKRDDEEAPSRRQRLGQTGLPPRPTVLLGEDGRTAVLVGSEPIGGTKSSLLDKLRKGRWMQLTPSAAGAIKLPADAEDDTP